MFSYNFLFVFGGGGVVGEGGTLHELDQEISAIKILLSLPNNDKSELFFTVEK